MIGFLAGLLLALSAGTADVSIAPAVDNADESMPAALYVTWQCPGRDDDETCFLLADVGGIHTGP